MMDLLAFGKSRRIVCGFISLLYHVPKCAFAGWRIQLFDALEKWTHKGNSALCRAIFRFCGVPLRRIVLFVGLGCCFVLCSWFSFLGRFTAYSFTQFQHIVVSPKIFVPHLQYLGRLISAISSSIIAAMQSRSSLQTSETTVSFKILSAARVAAWLGFLALMSERNLIGLRV